MIKRILRRLKLVPIRILSRAYMFVNASPFESLIVRSNVDSKVVWIIGNGPSVEIRDLEKIATSGMLSAVANRFHLIYGETSFRPDLIVSSDEDMIKDFGDEISRENPDNTVVFAVDNVFKEFDNALLLLRNYNKIQLRYGPIKSVYNGGGSLFTAIQVYYSLGFKDFVLYGIDHNFKFLKSGDKALGEGNHFIKGYRNGKSWIPPRTRQIEESFLRIKNQLEAEGGSIVNASRFTKLPHIKRVNFNEIL